MNITYRTDWIDPADSTRNTVKVSYHGPDLSGARAVARSMSRVTGSAYIIKSVDGKDVAHLPYTDGRADGKFDDCSW